MATGSFGGTAGYGGDTNTSGQGAQAEVPAELAGRWNWGAFLLTPIWGIGNSVWIALIAFAGIIPFVGPIISLGMAIWMGLKGSEMAWRAKRWNSVEHFKDVQRKWAIAGVVVLVLSVVFGFMLGFMMTAQL